jgi:hypothetical protein
MADPEIATRAHYIEQEAPARVTVEVPFEAAFGVTFGQRHTRHGR